MCCIVSVIYYELGWRSSVVMEKCPITKDYSRSIIVEELNLKTAAVSIHRHPSHTHVRCKVPAEGNQGIPEDVSDRS